MEILEYDMQKAIGYAKQVGNIQAITDLRNKISNTEEVTS
jgi:hypothetical protein